MGRIRPTGEAGRIAVDQATAGSTASISARWRSKPGGSFAPGRGWPPARPRRSGRVGGDLEQHPAGLPEVDRAEILPVALLGDAEAVTVAERLRHGLLRRIVGGPEGDVVHRARPLAAGKERAHRSQGDMTTRRRITRVAGRRALTAGLPEAEHARQDRRRALGLRQKERHSVQAADRMLGGYLAAGPAGSGVRIVHADQGEQHPVRIAETQGRLSEDLYQRLVAYALLNEPVGPPADGGAGHAEGGLLRLADADPAGGRVGDREEGQDRAGLPASSP